MRRIYNSATIILAARVCSLALSFATVPLIARELGPTGRGQTGAAISALLLAPVILAYGAPMLLRRVFAAEGDGANLLRASRILALCASVISVPAGMVIVRWLLPGLSHSESLAFIASMPACVIFGIMWICNSSVLIAHGRRLSYAVITLLPTLSFAISVGGMWAIGRLSVASVILSQGISYLTVWLVSHRLVGVSLIGSYDGLSTLMRRSSPFAGAQIAEAASYRMDQAVVIPVIGAYAAGQYSVAATISLLPLALGQAIAASSFSQISAEAADGEPGDWTRLLRVAISLGIASAVGVGVIVPFLVPALFGDEYRAAVGATWIGLIGAGALVLGQSASNVLIVQGRGDVLTRAQVLGLCFGLVLLMVLGPFWGLYGASIASAVGYLMTTILMVRGTRAPFISLRPRLGDWRALVGLFVRGVY